MVIRRGEIWWASLPEPIGAEPGYRRPVLVLQDDSFNRSQIATVVVVIITSNLRLAQAPGNVLLPARLTGLSQDSVVNVSQLFTADKCFLTERIGKVPLTLLSRIETGVRLVLNL